MAGEVRGEERKRRGVRETGFSKVDGWMWGGMNMNKQRWSGI